MLVQSSALCYKLLSFYLDRGRFISGALFILSILLPVVWLLPTCDGCGIERSQAGRAWDTRPRR